MINHNPTNKETAQLSSTASNNRSKMDCVMIIDILNDSILNALQNDLTSTGNESSMELHAQLRNLTFQAISKKYILDFKQAAAFEIMACSFILSSLDIEKISEEDIHHFFEENEEDSLKYTKCLKGLKKNHER